MCRTTQKVSALSNLTSVLCQIIMGCTRVVYKVCVVLIIGSQNFLPKAKCEFCQIHRLSNAVCILCHTHATCCVRCRVCVVPNTGCVLC